MTTMLLDSASLYYRAFYGVPGNVTAANGTPNNALRGFLDMIARLIETYEPTGLVACLDNDWRPQFRVDAIPSYKAHRVSDVDAAAEEAPDELTPQVPAILAALDALGICSVGVDGTEADDVIGTIAATGNNFDVVTGDRDLFQVVDDERAVRVLYTAKGLANMEILDDAALIAKYGVRAAQYADFATLRGDSSDGLPGVKGIGEKTAATLLAHYGDLDTLRSAAESDAAGPLKPAQRSNLLASTEYLDAAKYVVPVRTDLDIEYDPALPTSPADEAALAALIEEWTIGNSVARVHNAIATVSQR